jgi:primosomal protein N' (replication factor Y)
LTDKQKNTETAVVRVAVAVPIRGLFDYLPSVEGQIAQLQIGQRVLVPFGNSQRVAVIVDLLNKSDISPSLLKPIDKLLDAKPWLNRGDLEFLKWVASYYQHPAGEVILSALPVHLRKGNEAVGTMVEAWQITELGRTSLDVFPARARLQLAVLQFINAADRVVGRETLLGHFEKMPTAALRQLEEKKLLEKVYLPVLEDMPKSGQVDASRLNDEQQAAVARVNEATGFEVHLLHGITGSGKTEVYLALANHVLAQHKQVLILVPEISLTPQLLARFSARISHPMVVLHSALTDRQRSAAWQQVAAGEARVIVGTRSAIFTPLAEPGIIIVDEEHDISFKQQEGFRYSARDMAVARAKHLNCPVVLGSATPAFESLQNASRGLYNVLPLRKRAGNARLPAMQLIDIRSVRLEAGMSPVTRRLIAETLEQGQQVMVFLNRRGFAPVMTCHDCGWVARCKRCDANMTVHAGQHRLWCHHCGSQQRIPDNCPDCHGTEMTTLGQGTEKLEHALNHFFPDIDCVRIDYDATRRKGSMEEKLERVRSGQSRLLVGTQMLAKGHDFPGVTLVVLLDIDHGLFGTDFRAAERMAQQVTQVAGRAGRGETPGRVLIQTRHPEHPLLQVLLQHGYSAFAMQSLEERRQAGFPPFAFQALIRAEAGDANQPRLFLAEAVKTAGDWSEGMPEFWGPVPAIMQKKAGKHRFHLLLQSASRAGLHRFLDEWLEKIQQLPSARKVRWSIDIDPQDFYS